MSENTKDILFFIALFLAFGILWYYTGGPGRQLSKSGVRLSPQTVIDKNVPKNIVNESSTTTY